MSGSSLLSDTIRRAYANYPRLESELTEVIVKNRWLTVPHRSDTHLKLNGKWVTKTVLCEKRLKA